MPVITEVFAGVTTPRWRRSTSVRAYDTRERTDGSRQLAEHLNLLLFESLSINLHVKNWLKLQLFH